MITMNKVLTYPSLAQVANLPTPDDPLLSAAGHAASRPNRKSYVLPSPVQSNEYSTALCDLAGCIEPGSVR